MVFKSKKNNIKKIILKSSLFDKIFYLKEHKDVRLADKTPIDHYCQIGIKEDKQPNPFFNPAWYREHYEDVKTDGINPFIHYILFGRAENRFINDKEYSDYITIKESNLFDEKYYLEQNEDVKEAGIDPLLHFVRIGYTEGRKPNLSFNPQWYRKHYEEVKADGINPFIHYILFGRAENRFIDEKECLDYTTIKESNLFDEKYYLEKNQDVKKAGVNPLLHFIRIGYTEGRKPNQSFHPIWYIKHNKDIKTDDLNPFIHYILFGRAENRFINEKEYSDYITIKESNLFDEKYYLKQNEDVKEAEINPLLHFIRIGHTKNKQPNPFFNPAWYGEHYEDVKVDNLNPFIHYILFGKTENRFINEKEYSDYITIKESNIFDEKYYLEQNENIKKVEIAPILHFIRIGHTDNKQPNPSFNPTWYRKHYRDVKVDGINPFIHYILFGRAENRFINEKEYSDYITIKESNLFDEEYYLEQNKDVKEAEIDPLLHFSSKGYIDHRKPNPTFDPVWYEEHYKDVKESNIPPIIHYIRNGRAENRFINAEIFINYTTIKESNIFDEVYYLQKNEDVVFSGMTALEHYVKLGLYKNKKPNSTFDPVWYKEHYKDVKESNIPPIIHYIRNGRAENRFQNEEEYINSLGSKNNVPSINESSIYIENETPLLNKLFLDFENYSLEYKIDLYKDFFQIYIKELSLNKNLLKSKVNTISKLSDRINNLLENESKNSFTKNNYKNLISILYNDNFKEKNSIKKNLKLIPFNFIENFNEKYYLERNGDLRKAIETRKFFSGLEHFLNYGVNDILQGKRVLYKNSEVYKSEKKNILDLNENELKDFFNYLNKNVILENNLNIDKFKIKEKQKTSRLEIEQDNLINYFHLKYYNMKSMPKVSMIILTKDGLNYIKTLFSAIYTNTVYSNFEIIVVDNASKDSTVSFLKQNIYDFDIKIIENKKNESFSKANNQASEIATGELLLLLNNDVEPLKGWLCSLVKTYLKDPKKIGSVGAKLIYPYKEEFKNSCCIQHSGIAIRYEGSFFRPYNLGNGDDAINHHIEQKDRAAVTAACVLISKEKYLEVNGLDEEYNYGYEDVDLGLKLLSKGYRNVYTPNARLFHYEFGTQSEDSKLDLSTRRQKNIQVFRKKWHKFLKDAYWNEKFNSNTYIFKEKRLKIAIAVTAVGANVTEGDYFTGLELGLSFEKLGFDVTYLSRKENEWYSIGEDVDILISLLDAYDLNKLPARGKQLITIAWARNWFDRWCDNKSFEKYDLVFASSKISCDYINQNSRQKAQLLPIATNVNRFKNEITKDSNFACDYCFTGSHWGELRDIAKYLEPAKVKNKKFNIYGENWNKIEKFSSHNKGFIKYEEMPLLYENTKIILDDANHVTKPFGAVNSRVFDALGKGKLVITNGMLGSKELFNGRLPFYETEEELHELLTYFLENDQEREDLAKELQLIVEKKHTYDNRAATIKKAIYSHVTSASLIIKIPAPRWDIVHEWGDYHLALAFKRSLEKKGVVVRLQVLEEWNDRAGLKYDNVFVLRGLSEYITKPTQYNIMWNISHPDKVNIDEYNKYDLVLIASDIWAEEIASKTTSKVEVMHQCTDTELFHFPTESEKKEFHNEILFVGNSRNVYRKVIKDLLPTKHNLSIYGSLWNGLVPKKYIKGKYIPNDILYKYYGSANIVLNDHWDDMRAKGFLSNRIYDALASGAQIITDEIIVKDKILKKYFFMYKNKDDLQLLINKIEENNLLNGKQNIIDAREYIKTNYSVISRANSLFNAIKCN